MVMQNQLCWAGHCIRMSDNRLPGQVLYSHLTHSTRTRGGQRKWFKETAKHYMKKGQIDINAEELKTADFGAVAYTMQRPNLRQTVYFTRWKYGRGEKREMSQHLHVSLPSGTSCPHCNRICRSRIGLLSYLRTHDRPLEDSLKTSSSFWGTADEDVRC